MKARAALLLAFLLTASLAHAHRDWFPPPTRVEKTYALPEPFGTLRVIYAGDAEEPSLRVESDGFKVSLPQQALTDLPAPDWDHFVVVYCMPNARVPASDQRPCVYIEIKLREPSDPTWVSFGFDAEGAFTRWIRRDEPLPGNVIRSLSNEWKIGSGISAEEALRAARDRLRTPENP